MHRDIRIRPDIHPVGAYGRVRAFKGAYGSDIFKLVGILTSTNNSLHMYGVVRIVPAGWFEMIPARFRFAMD